MTDTALRPGSTIGILGGGQLGRMLALSAARLGMKSHIYCPDPQSPAFDVTPLKTIAGYEDEQNLQAFAQSVDVVTYEFENVPVLSAELVARHTRLAPSVRALEVSQDRIKEKQFLEGAGIRVAPWAEVLDRDGLERAVKQIGIPSVLKTTRLGYDGKGQRMLNAPADIDSAFAEIGGQPLVLEGFVPFEREISVVVARSANNQIAAYEPAENVHEHHILKTSTVPANISAKTAELARATACKIVESLDYVGVMGVEFFVGNGTDAPELLVNEIAPRVHNSGHWTELGCMTDQFEQHIRAICNWPLGDTQTLVPVQMENLIGDDVLGTISAAPGAQPHLYGKAEIRPGRKMGHINRVHRAQE